MFYQNIGYHWSRLGQEIRGAIFGPAYQDIEHLLRRSCPNLGTKLFDPQLYFLDSDDEIEPEHYGLLLSRLSTYEWFGINSSPFDSTSTKASDWRNELKSNIEEAWRNRTPWVVDWPNKVASCVRLQEDWGVSQIILPSMTVHDQSGNIEKVIAALDEAILVAQKITDRPLLASLPLSERLLQYSEIGDLGFVDSLAEQVLSREELAGAYIPVVSGGERDRLASRRTVLAVLRLCQALGANREMSVVPNFIETLGFAAMALGATGYGSGYAAKHRRFAVSDFRQSSGGIALPKFFSMGLVVDLWPERDLERLPSRHTLRLVEGDETPASAALFSALKNGRRVGSIVEWEERRNNVGQAAQHYCQLQYQRAVQTPTFDEALTWLVNAERDAQYLVDRFRDDPLLALDTRHLPVWRTIFEQLAP